MARFRKNDFFKWTQLLIFKAKIIKKMKMSKKMMIFYSFPFNFLWKSLVTLMTMTLMTGPFWGDWKMIMTLNDFDPSWPEFSVERKWPLSSYWGERSFWFLSHAARYSERSSDSGQYADGYLQNCFPSFHFFWVLNVECWMLNFLGRIGWTRG